MSHIVKVAMECVDSERDLFALSFEIGSGSPTTWMMCGMLKHIEQSVAPRDEFKLNRLYTRSTIWHGIRVSH